MLKKTLGLIALLLLLIAGEIVWLMNTDLSGKWKGRVGNIVQDQLTGFGQQEAAPVATLGDAQGTVTVTRDGESMSLVPFMTLREGDWIETGADGNVEIAWTGYGRTIMDANSKIEISSASRGSTDDGLIGKIRLESGRVWTRFEKLLDRGSQFQVRASNVVATVRGTSFGVERQPGTSVQIKVRESQVSVGRTAGETSDTLIGTEVVMNPAERMAMSEDGTDLPKVQTMSQKEMQADTFMMLGDRPIPTEYMDADWMAFVEMILSQIPPDQLPEDFDRAAFIEYMRQIQSEIPDEVKQQYMQEYQSGQWY